MEYQVVFIINNERKTLVLEHVKEEYGVSEQEFWCSWIKDEAHVQGDGDTAEAAINNMLMRCDMQRQGFALHQQIQSLKGTATWYTPIIGEAHGQ